MNSNNSIFSLTGKDPAIIVSGVRQVVNPSPLHHPKGAGFFFIYVLSGEISIESPNLLVHAEIGSMVMIHPSEECVIYKNKGEISYILFCVSGFLLEAASDVLTIPHVFSGKLNRLDTFLYACDIYPAYKTGDGTVGRKMCDIALSFLLDVADYRSEEEIVLEKPSASAIKDLLDISLCADIDLDYIGNRFDITGMHVIRLFKNEYDITPMLYLKSERLKKAAGLLVNSDFTIKFISELLHFSSTQHFTNLFKEQFGISPGKYRLDSQNSNLKNGK